jgi:tetratricopeptide (TPR) repeat protein
MSPEQAQLDHFDIDTRSDVYSLGVLLYELLTGTTPLERKRMKQVAVLELLRLVREEEAPRPSTRLSTVEELPSIAANRGLEPKKLSGLVRGELDWIVMKALEKDRDRRYESANGLAMDLQRYLHDEPVQACPPRAGYRLKKFVRRHSGAVMVASLILVLLVGAIVGTTAGLLRALRAERRAQENLRLALESLDRIYVQVAEQSLPRDPQRKKEDQELLKKALEFYDQFAQQNSGEAAVRLDVGRAYRRVGDIQQFVGENKAAQEAYREALAKARELAAKSPSNAEFSFEVALCCNKLAEALLAAGDLSGATEHFRQAIDLLTKLSADDATAPQYRAELARSYRGLGQALYRQGERRQADDSFRQAIDIQSKLAADYPTTPQYRLELAATHQTAGWSVEALGPYHKPDEVEHMRRARELLSQLAAEFPESPSYRYRLAVTTQRLAIFPGLFASRSEYYQQAIAQLSKLVAEFPQVPEYRNELGVAHGNFADLHSMMGNWEQEENHTRQSLALHRKLAAEFPAQISYREGLAVSLANWADVLVRRGEFGNARKALEESLGHERALLEANPNTSRHAAITMATEYQLASLAAAQGADAEATRLRQDADQLFEKTWKRLGTLQGSASAGNFCASIARGLQEGGESWKKVGKLPEMAAAYAAALKAYTQAVMVDPSNADAFFRRGELNAKLGKHEDAAADFSKVIDLDPKQPGAWYNDGKSATPWRNRATAYLGSRQYDKAITDLNTVLKTNPNDAWAYSSRANAYMNLRQYEKAIPDLNKLLQANPSDAAVSNNLAWLLATCADSKLRDPPRAVELAMKAVKLAEKDGGAWNTLGVAQYRAGNWKGAIEGLQKSMELRNGGDSSDWFFLAMAQWQLGNKDDARKWYDKAVQWMEKNQPKNEELGGFRAEAETRLKIEKKAMTK